MEDLKIFTVMGSCPDGGVIRARDHKEAFIKYMWLDYEEEDKVGRQEVVDDVERTWGGRVVDFENANFITFGDYEIKLCS